MAKPIIDEKKCTNCNTCVDICPVNVFEKGEKTAIVKLPDECIGCRACEVQCPELAIVVED
ncbi:MAG: ferredoxin family protein [Candidatus Woesearchaeota archaeon]